MKDAPSCEKCGQTFPWNQPHLRWKHKCSGPPVSGKPVAKPAPTVAMWKTLPLSTKSGFTGSSTTSRKSESDAEPAATDEDAPKCEKCGRTFPWNQLHLRWKHKCEPAEVTHTQGYPRRRSVSNLRRPMSVASTEQLLDSSTLEHGVRNGVDGTGAQF